MSMLTPEFWQFSSENLFRLVNVTGEDAADFLQGQLTQDVKTLAEDEARWTASCNYQGRVASSALIVRIPGGFGLLMPASIAEEEVQRLSKYILRSKVEIAIAPVPVLYFCTSDAKAAKTPCPALPREVMKTYHGNSAMVIRLPNAGSDGYYAKFIALGTIPHMIKTDNMKENQLPLALMHEGVALIDESQHLEWLPQALNMDLIGAISFNKGCYTGQEVISKTQNLGKVKRRLFLGKIDLENIDVGTEVFMENEPQGRVIQSSGKQILFVLPFEYMDSELFVKNSPVKILDLPYNVSVPESVLK